jgi:hypothetical protein
MNSIIARLFICLIVFITMWWIFMFHVDGIVGAVGCFVTAYGASIIGLRLYGEWRIS